ncbi:ATP-binding cassette domain-containing protein [Geitlerinema calcuttense]|uniref:Daunorubicin/doxorubicin resistance ABC transporter ATP-binding protein DrrA n=2 Tax=Cyanophyceae TaxID=3028117 RepID=A0A1E5QPJ4_9CYAN|nr:MULTISPECIES: ATP-binding cassette domain-containing protein [Cyanophyceae]MCD8490036.1 ATP-binding cassette domain-containing protein [Desertifilum sp.]MDL5052267.1 ATP-binding cassette domain-containing protein [Oscillatoria laete-virens NRMC-F 0139]MDL5057771.1 ATP-binding cassette domain-containing protein [Geitlerinema calcuttense NRMC-F 0142]OEJ76568.1 daunorubicin/doxorubicin resistance ABC transporter ATP-binding protein DrrA [Desertifilum tharense IPPAS B-1220]
MNDLMVEVQGLKKRFGNTEALRGINLSVAAGSVLGVLGPNGAGKTTTINCLTTLIKPDAGKAAIAGYDIIRDPASVRALISVTGQFAAVDEELTARENLILFGRLLRLSHHDAAKRATELLEQFDLMAAGNRRVKEFSGGMRRRLDLAASIVAEPLVLFLDEPTTGLDPRSRQQLWDVVRELKQRGITIFLTTQYLEEADELADRIVVIDRGEAIAEGTADELKDRVGGTYCEIRLADPRDEAKVRQELGELHQCPADGTLALPAPDRVATLIDVVRRMDAIGVTLADISLRRPSLDDVFFELTGHTTEDANTKS